MKKIVINWLLCCSIATIFYACSSSKKTLQPISNISSLKYLGKYDMPFNQMYKNTVVGGLSGIDYDRKNDVYNFICDDRSEKSPARFYTARIFFTPNGIDSIAFTDVHFLRQPNGNVFPDSKENRFLTPDPEAIRYNPVAKNLVWTSEGERIVNSTDTVLKNPSIHIIDAKGNFKDSFPLPANLDMQVNELGPRRNGVFEGATFANNYKTLYVNIEEPLYEDGPRADVIDNNAYIRILQFDVATKKNTAQFAYKLDPVAYPATPPTAFKINGVPDILSIGENKLLVIERSFSTGRLACTIKVFEAEMGNATNITNENLSGFKNFTPVQKKLLLNMDELGIYTDNIEGVTFGPTLPNRHKTLLFVADNNFNELEKAQLLLFEVIE